MSLFQTLKPKPKNTNSATCLLLDVSGSMDERINCTSEDGIAPRRIEVLFKAVRETSECSGLKPYVFSDFCKVIEVIPNEEEALNYATHGTTDLALAFDTVKQAGFYNAILVTDGEPDSELKAITAAYDMKLGIIYIGDPPVPSFLKRLAEATDGTFELADMRSSVLIGEAIIHALPAPEINNSTTITNEGIIKL